MKNKSILLLAVFIASQILSSCSQVKLVSIEKRRYMDGYHVDIMKKNNNTRKKLSEREGINNALALAADAEQKKDNQTMQSEKEMIAESTVINKQNIASGQFTAGSNNKPDRMINKKDLKKEIRKNIKEVLAHHLGTQSVNTPTDVSKGITLMIVGGALFLLGIVLVPLSWQLAYISYLLIVAGLVMGIAGLVIYLTQEDDGSF